MSKRYFSEEFKTSAGTFYAIGCEDKLGNQIVNVGFMPDGSEYCLDLCDVKLPKSDPGKIRIEVYAKPEQEEPSIVAGVSLKRIREVFEKEGYFENQEGGAANG